MRKAFILLILMIPLLAVSNYKGRVWWEKPVFEVKPLDVGPFMVYKTPFKDVRFFLTKGGVLLYKDWQLTLYSPSFRKRAAMGGLDEVMNKVCKSLCDFQVIIPKDDGRKAVLGFADQDIGVYRLVMVDLDSGKWREIGELKGEKFPGYAPAEKMREMFKNDKSSLKDYRWIVFHGPGLKPSYWVGDKLYLWFSPDAGMSFGGLYILDLKSGKIEFPFKNLDIIIGVNDKYMAYSLFSDPNATDVPPVIWIKKGKEKFSIKNADPHNALLSSHWLLYRKLDHVTWVLYDLQKRKAVGSFKVENGDNKALFLTPSGKRVFMEAVFKGKKSLYLYDFRQGKFYNLFPQGGEGFRVQACYDGEIFLFSHRDELWTGYLTDLTPPDIKVKVSPLYKGRAFKSPVNLRVEVRDRCFVSGVSAEVVLNGKKYPLKGDSLSVEFKLKQGENLLEITAGDRAGNSAHIRKKIIYEKPPRVSLMEIGKNPAKYQGKLIFIEGWAWGWMAKGPAEAKKLPLAPGNTAKSRNWGSIEDGTAVALFPISPSSSGKVRVYAVVKVKGNNWLLEPLEIEFVSKK